MENQENAGPLFSIRKDYTNPLKGIKEDGSIDKNFKEIKIYDLNKIIYRLKEFLDNIDS